MKSLSFVLLVAMSFVVWLCSTTLQAQSDSLELKETDAALTVTYGTKTVLVYNKTSPPVPDGMDPVFARSGFLHPVNTPSGKTVTQAFPKDHAHQHGIFFAWVKTKYGDRSIDFWNLAGRTGRVVHDRVASKNKEGDRVSFEVDLIHRAENPTVDILREHWKITVQAPSKGVYCFDIESNQKALTDTPLVIEKYHYGGMAFRGLTKWLAKVDQLKAGDDKIEFESCTILNSAGQDRKAGNHTPANWVALTGLVDKQSVSIAVLSYPQNFRSPQPARLHESKPYFCFTPCVTDSFEITKEKPLQSKYRYILTDAQAEPGWLDAKWQELKQ